jgi:hypothetical protein
MMPYLAKIISQMIADYKLRLSSKKLLSGRFQINFSTEGSEEGYYGYVLAESKTSVREVIERIGHHLEAIHYTDRYFQPNLFSMGRKKEKSAGVMIFKRTAAHG